MYKSQILALRVIKMQGSYPVADRSMSGAAEGYDRFIRAKANIKLMLNSVDDSERSMIFTELKKSLIDKQKFLAMTSDAIAGLIGLLQSPLYFPVFSAIYDADPVNFCKASDDQESLHMYIVARYFKEGLLDIVCFFKHALQKIPQKMLKDVVGDIMENTRQHAINGFLPFSRYHDNVDSFISKLNNGAEEFALKYMANLVKYKDKIEKGIDKDLLNQRIYKLSDKFMEFMGLRLTSEVGIDEIICDTGGFVAKIKQEQNRDEKEGSHRR